MQPRLATRALTKTIVTRILPQISIDVTVVLSAAWHILSQSWWHAQTLLGYIPSSVSMRNFQERSTCLLPNTFCLYLRSIRNQTIRYSRHSHENPNVLWGWVYADWAGDTDTCRHGIFSWWMVAPFLRRVDAKITCHFPLPRLNLSVLAKLANKRSTYVKRCPILDFVKLKPLFSKKTTLLVLRWEKIKCAESSPFRVIFVSTMCVNSSSLDSSSSCLCARTKWWLMPSQKACCPRLSSGTAKSWLVMLLSPLAYYVASGANFERWLWALRFL